MKVKCGLNVINWCNMKCRKRNCLIHRDLTCERCLEIHEELLKDRLNDVQRAKKELEREMKRVRVIGIYLKKVVKKKKIFKG